MSKNAHNASVLCGYCSNSFTYYSAPSIPAQKYCSPNCRNKARILPDVPCEICGKMFHPQSWGAKGRKRTCSQSCARHLQIKWHPQKIKVWTKERIAFLQQHYPTKGAEYCVKHLGVTLSAVRTKANRIGLKLTSEAYNTIVHGAAQAYMSANNPMHNPETVAKVQDWYIKHPEERQKLVYKSLQSKRQFILDTASNVQEQLWCALNDAGIAFEKEYLVQPHYLIDTAIPEQMLAVELYGCYWHGHDCRFPKLSKRQKEQEQRDKKRDIQLTKQGWTIIHIWECEVNSSPNECVNRITETLLTHPCTK